ncbi:hypothetical protein [Nocardia bovistercoris]|uniref:Uncharacterized protein n=1 Tax=Nocardia bovistercoris TaxID=2785916 RepID=A0A931N2W4_9NOCA|nr:hypothetical protein [Nocardia bovistercoris]MBH0777289.1 hypothetical protein [Nocardia bovistercoris]
MAVLVSVGALFTSTRSCAVSTEANEIARGGASVAREQADLARQEAAESYAPAFEIVYRKPGTNTVTHVDISVPRGERFVLDRKIVADRSTWLEITVMNTSKKAVGVNDVGLVNSLEGSSGLWVRSANFRIPETCASNSEAGRDVRCFNFPISIPEGEKITIRWPMGEPGIGLPNRQGAYPLVVGLQTGHGPKIFETNLRIS